MILQKLDRILGGVSLCLLLTACHAPAPYETKQNCLSRVIAACKNQGWKFATTNPVCVRAADEGIYGLSCTELMACRAADEQAKAHQ